jgi:hypothetical protein
MSEDLTAVRNHALRLLAQNPDGRTGAMMIVHGFSIALLNQLIACQF